MDKLPERLEAWKKHLLDLGKRNRLINFRETKRSNIEITEPNIYEFYNRLVLDEETLTFSFPVDESEDADEMNIVKGDLNTNRGIVEQQKTLRSLRLRAKTAVEEQGINILHLVFGFLKWKENKSSDWIMSPLILVPVTLTVSSITSPFKLNIHDDEIILNPTLSYKLSHDYGIEVKNFDNSSGSLIDYLIDLKLLVESKKWMIIETVSLGLFSYLKVNMYKDLEKNYEKINNHPLLKQLVGDFCDDSFEFGSLNDFNHDKEIKPINSYQVLDADSSQQDAILYSKKGLSFVLQGPPGTGKSQTIANIISEALADSKKVLFVSEKMAALEVVYSRLSQCNLDDFCLRLHSHKANKKEVLNDLVHSFELPDGKVNEEVNYNLDKLFILKNDLNDYVEQLHRKMTPLNISVYEVNGIISSLQNEFDISFKFNEVNSITSEELNITINLLDNLALKIQSFNVDYHNNPWFMCRINHVTYELKQDIEVKSQRIIPVLNQLLNDLYDCLRDLSLNMELKYSNIQYLIDVLEYLSKKPTINNKWLKHFNYNDLMEQTEYFIKIENEYEKLLSVISRDYEKSIWDFPYNELKEKANRFLKEYNLSKACDSNDWVEIDSLNSIINELLFTRNSLNHMADVAKQIENEYGLQKVKTIDDFINVSKILDHLNHDLRPTQEWFNYDNEKVLISFVNELKVNVYTEINLKNKIEDDYDIDILNIPYIEILRRFRSDYTSLFKYLKRNYKKDKKIIRSYQRSVSRKQNDKKIIESLQSIKNYSETRDWIKSKEPLIDKYLGNYFNHEFTDWERIDNAILEFNQLQVCLKLNEIPNELKEQLINQKLNINLLKDWISDITSIFSDDCINRNKQLIVDESKTLSERVEITDNLINQATELRDICTRYRKLLKIQKTAADIFDDICSLNRKISIEKEFIKKETNSSKLFGDLYHGVLSNWEEVKKSINWTYHFLTLTEKYLTEDFINTINKLESEAKIKEYFNKINTNYHDINGHLTWFINLFTNDNVVSTVNFDLTQMPLAQFSLKLKNCLNNIPLLDEWVDLKLILDKCNQRGLNEYLNKIIEKDIKDHSIVDSFKKRFYILWLDYVSHELNQINGFRLYNQKQIIQQFKDLDVNQLIINSSRVREIILNNRPNVNGVVNAFDQASILKHEANKQRKILPLRKLFEKIPNLLLKIKPCFMMSPLSVSLFLQSDCFEFDMIIFDEASQVKTEDAIGAIMRGKQVIIAGDTKQLPPTNFFLSNVTESDFDSENEEEDESYAFDSILEEAAIVFPERSLKWHYRSKSEELITFSNSTIYNYSLITFPSTLERSKNNGVEYVYVNNGIYDRGGKKNNINEAKKVVDLIFEHYLNFPNRSLGVVTFSGAQQDAVEAELRHRRLKNQNFETFFNEEINESFFIKNLENVQGDERDTIILSIGYAKDVNGQMHMNFGPLSRDNGYRRLNVAITRAKYNLKLVGSILPTDILTENVSSEGVKLLRLYIDYAINGTSILNQQLLVVDSPIFDSPFEESVYLFLISKGYNLSTQVGCSGYRIDLAIKHPQLDGRYVLGIECDGASYHSARTARERDRLRQDILENMGWTIYRIWSTDWIKDPLRAKKTLIENVENAIKNYRDEMPITIDDIPHENEVTFFETEDINSIEENNYGFDFYSETNILYDSNLNYSNSYIANIIYDIVKNEHPVHFESICKRILPFYNKQKITKSIREEITSIIFYHLNGKVIMKNDFLYDVQDKKISVKIPKNESSIRPIKYISDEELQQAIISIVKNSYGLSKDNLINIIAKYYQFKRVGINITNTLLNALQDLIKNKVIKEIEGKILMNV